MLRLASHQCSQRLLIQQMVLGSCLSKTLALTAHALGAGHLGSNEVVSAIGGWKQVRPAETFEAILQFERAVTLQHFDLLHRDAARRLEASKWPEETARIFDLEDPPAWLRGARRWVQEPLWPWLWPEHDTVLSLRQWNLRVNVAHAVHIASWADAAISISGLDVASGFIEDIDLPGFEPPCALDRIRGRFSLGGPRIFPDHAFFRTAYQAEVSCRLAETALALEGFRQLTGRFPNQLSEVIPHWLPEVPMDPMDGKPLRYRPLGNGYVLHSVGTDGRNDGGSVRSDGGETYRTPFDGQDWVFRRVQGPSTVGEHGANEPAPALLPERGVRIAAGSI